MGFILFLNNVLVNNIKKKFFFNYKILFFLQFLFKMQLTYVLQFSRTTLYMYLRNHRFLYNIFVLDNLLSYREIYKLFTFSDIRALFVCSYLLQTRCVKTVFTVKVYQSAGAVTVPGLEPGEYVVSVVVVQGSDDSFLLG